MKTDTVEDFVEKVNENPAHLILIINKIDLINQEKLEVLVDKWKALFPRAEIIPVSALEKFNVIPLFNRIKDLLPESPPFFEKDQLTDKPARFFVNEIIREKILMHYDKEIPYAVEVVVEQFQEDDKLIRINAVINVERDSQKGIIIGHKGDAIKKTLTQARLDMEKFFGKKVFIESFVKVKKDWRDNDLNLRDFGYDG